MRKGFRERRILVGAMVMALAPALVFGATPSAAGAADPIPPDVSSIAAAAAAEAMPTLVDSGRSLPGGVACGPVVASSQICVGSTGAGGTPNLAQGQAASSGPSVLPLPSWCTSAPLGSRITSRLESCEIDDLYVIKYFVDSSGAREVGRASLTYYNWQYTSFAVASVVHQFGYNVYAQTGDLSGVLLSVAGSCSGPCVVQAPASTPAVGVVLDTWWEASGSYGPMDSLAGSIYQFSTDSTLTADFPGGTYSTATPAPFNVRCDNATPGNAKAGCAIWYVPGELTYARSALPTFTTHVMEAISSGLHGGSILDPVHRTTDPNLNDLNGRTACASAPSLPLLSCDEYPFRSTYEGAASGGVARSFPNCVFLDPPATGPVGFSRCMISATENSSAGGILSGVYRNQRLLDEDPFFVDFTWS